MRVKVRVRFVGFMAAGIEAQDSDGGKPRSRIRLRPSGGGLVTARLRA
jgi:hypothetical protein